MNNLVQGTSNEFKTNLKAVLQFVLAFLYHCHHLAFKKIRIFEKNSNELFTRGNNENSAPEKIYFENVQTAEKRKQYLEETF